MDKVYKGRQSWRSAGFVMIAVTSWLSLGVVALFIVGLINNSSVSGTAAPPFNITASLVVFGVTMVVWLTLLWGVTVLMRNVPQTIQLSNNSLVIQTEPPTVIPLTAITNISTTQVPVSYLGYKASFTGLLVKYLDNESTARTFILSERDTSGFDELSERLRALSPKPTLGKRK